MRFPRRDRPFLKICCIQTASEAELAIACGADALGLVSAMPSGPGPIEEGVISEIVAAVGCRALTFLLTCARDPETIIGQLRRTGAALVQLVDAVEVATLEAIAEALPSVGIVAVVHVQGAASEREALDLAALPMVDAVLLDSGNPGQKELGGTGRVHDWATSAAIVRSAPKPVFLAGGLRPHNVLEALETVRPYGLDLCTGVRTDDRLDRAKLESFTQKFR